MRKIYWAFLFLLALLARLAIEQTFADDKVANLQSLIDEALANNPELNASYANVSASGHRIPQEKSLPDPMLMVGYQNEGFDQYTYGMMPDSMWMFSISQMFPFPTKLSTKGKMAASDFESAKKMHESLRLNIILRVKMLYYDLFLAHKSLELIKENVVLFEKIEDAARARYASGMAPLQEVIMAQTEKYMLAEKEEMLTQKMHSLEAMLNAVVGREINTPVGRPVELTVTDFAYSLDDLLKIAGESSPEIVASQKMKAASESRLQMAKKEYLPDFTLTAKYSSVGSDFEDMWSLEAGINLPIFFWTKQRRAVLEASEHLSASKSKIEATRLMLFSSIKDNYSMLKSSERLLELYKSGLIPKTHQDFEAALTGYVSGKVEAITVISRLKSLVDYELMYWTQFTEREKAIARIEALTGLCEAK